MGTEIKMPSVQFLAERTAILRFETVSIVDCFGSFTPRSPARRAACAGAAREEGGEQNLHRVAGEERNDAVAHAGGQIQAGDRHEPDRAECITDGDAEHHGQAEGFEIERELTGERADDQRAEDVAQNIAAGLAEEHRGAAAEAREHRHADDAQQRVDDHGERTVFPAQQRAAQMHGEQREVDREPSAGESESGEQIAVSAAIRAQSTRLRVAVRREEAAFSDMGRTFLL